MNSIKSVLLGIAAAASVLVPVADSNAWVAAARGWGGRSSRCGWLPRRLLPRWRMLGLWRGSRRRCRPGCWSRGRECRAACNRRRCATGLLPAHPFFYPQGNVPLGTQVAYLPPGANSMVVNGLHYYQSGPTWYKPYYGSSGVYYEVVPAP